MQAFPNCNLGYIYTENSDKEILFKEKLSARSENLVFITNEPDFTFNLSVNPSKNHLILMLNERADIESSLKLIDEIRVTPKTKETLLKMTKSEGLKKQIGDGPAYV